MYLIFDTQEDAITANNKISQNMELTGNITAKWADVIQTSDNKFAILKPEERFLNNVSGFLEQETILIDNIIQEI